MVEPEFTLRAVQPPDVDAFYAHQSDLAAAQQAAVVSRDRDAHDAHWAKILIDPDTVIRTIVIPSSLVGSEVAGHIVSFVHEGRREVGYWLGRAHWGRGLASAALGAFLTIVPERPLFATAAAHNPASVAILRRHGFRETRRWLDAGIEIIDFDLQ